MLYLVIKAVLSGIVVVTAAKLAERSPLYGAFIVSLPLVAILTLVWLWRDTADKEKVAALSESAFWLALPTLPMFFALPVMLRHGFTFWHALAISCVLTSVLYAFAIWFLPRFGIRV
jgi:hypothetical protein